MSDMEKSFAFLTDSIPTWQQDVAALQEKAAAMQHDLGSAPAATRPFAKHASDSMASLRPERIAAILEEAAPSPTAQTDPAGAHNPKTPSVPSGRASVPSGHRPRTMVVVSYDGDMQKSFELLVRAIGTGRNLLRKAKMEAKMLELTALTGSSEDEDETDETDDTENEAVLANTSPQPRMASMRAHVAARRGGAPNSSSPATPVALFDTTDKALGHAQSLCEKAAHATLRDGDCRKELEDLHNSFAAVLETAKTQITRHISTTPSNPPTLQSNNTSDASLSSIEEPSCKKHFPQLSLPPPEHQAKTTLTPAPTGAATLSVPKIMNLEADDDDDDDEPEFVMPSVRLASRFAVRA